MGKKALKNAVTALFFLNLLLPGCAAIGSKQAPSPVNLPPVKADCTLCHTSADGARGALQKPVSELCQGCHPARMTSGHKIDVVPSVVVPQLPLKDGKMTCITCHDPHSNAYPRMLRVQGKELCLLCHKY